MRDVTKQTYSKTKPLQHYSGLPVAGTALKIGKGLFTEVPIPKGACIIEYTGRPVSKADQFKDEGKYLFWTGKNTMINGNIPSNKVRYINHSCSANCEADGPRDRVFVLALRNIKAGEELTYDYGDEYFDKHIKPKGCRCPKCAKKKPQSVKVRPL